MILKIISENQKKEYNKAVTHIMQSWEWGEFRKSLGGKVLRFGLYQNGKLQKAFQLTLHKIPLTSFFVGYLPKGPFPDKDLAEVLVKIGQEQNCAFIKIEPDVILRAKPEGSLANTSTISETLRPRSGRASLEILCYAQNDSIVDQSFRISPKPLFTKYNFIVDLTKSEEELFKNMHPKFRYNIKVAQKHGIWVEERADDKALKIHLKLYFETAKRQNYHGHNIIYHYQLWKILKEAKLVRLLIAFYPGPNKKPIPLASWMLINFKDILYYPYGGSSPEYKNVMASNLLAWEGIKFGKRLKFKKFDLWGALGPDASPNDSWQGFTRFKKGMGGDLVEYLGTYDLVFNPLLYFLFTAIDRLMWLKLFLLKFVDKG